jgi:peptidyl-prolyl cis-trans isomerase B (cyclophilin B)
MTANTRILPTNHEPEELITMKYIIASLFIIYTISSHAQQQVPQVTLQTNMGAITIELMPEEAPISSENFLNYAQAGFYEGSIFHRVVEGFVVQGGGYTVDYQAKPTDEPIQNEANNGLQNTRGSVAMARSSDPHSATSQFFINVSDNHFLDYRSATPGGWGYAIFAKVVDGMQVVDEIQKVPTGAAGEFSRNVPLTPIIIEAVTVQYVGKSLDTAEPTEEPIEEDTQQESSFNREDEEEYEAEEAEEAQEYEEEETEETEEAEEADVIDSKAFIPAPDSPSKPDIPEPAAN